MAKKCGDIGCKELPELVCVCSTNNYFCNRHLINHIKEVGEHRINSIFMKIKHEDYDGVINSLNKKCENLVQTRVQLKKLCLEIIDSITSKFQEANKKLSKDLMYYRKIKKTIFESREIDRDEYNNAFSDEIVLITKDFSQIKEYIETTFDKYFRVDNLYNTQDNTQDKYYSYVIGNNLVKIDLDTLKKTQVTMPYSLTYNNSCKLFDGKFFINSGGSVNCYILDLKFEKIEQVTNYRVNTYYGVLRWFGDCVYMINGHSTQMHDKYNLKTKQWSQITPCPLTAHFNTGGIIFDKLCITCYIASNAYLYDPKTNKYSANLNLAQGYKFVGHGFILTTQSVYKVKGNDPIQWEIFEYKHKDADCCHCMVNSYIFRRGKYLYFCSCGQKFFRFDTELFEYRTIATT